MKLGEIYLQIWGCLAAAASESDHAFNAMQASTIGLDGAPNVRTVALRRVSEPENLISFHTDLRSPKVAELDREPRIALAGVDSDRKLQIRVFGEARIIRDGPMRVDAWKASRDHDLVQYRTLLSPGTPIAQPRDAFGDKGDIPGPDEGLAHFCVVEVRAVGIDWLDLSEADNPKRARFIRSGNEWTRRWIAP
ncbi:pyridoxamine 5'-phosphate oxidase family protein [Paraburkholderia dilworthii]|uniref:pyridoxamine 5'-phosphate oxidase family protein n=1 Tax=Paraburkholderia dilworthii TaxID=948106 RepID=UPI00047F3311|nr:pyridoxamine 5'-phosphate oxidase family protein [Paraburkholderia dilworthii]